MSTYPIKLLKDENEQAFFPFITTDAVRINNSDESLQDILDDTYSKEAVDQKFQDLGTVQRLCGRVPTVADLPSDAEAGDTYLVGTPDTDNAEYMWIGSSWERLGQMTDLSGYYTSSEVDTLLSNQATTLTGTMDTKDANTLSSAKSYADGQASAAETSAKSYADSVGTSSVTSAKDYTDAAISGIVVPTNVSQLNNDSGYITGLFEATYNVTSYADIKAAVDAHKIVYCKISSGRYAFLAYSGGNCYEFQYYRSNTTHDFSNRDEIFVYKITKGNNSDTWETIQRKTELLYKAGTGIKMSTPNNNSETTVSLDTDKVLLKNNTNTWTPTGNYQPATKKYVDDAVAGGGATPVYYHISASSSTDVGTDNSAHILDLTTLQKGIHIFKNYQRSTKLYYEYKKTSNSSYTSTSKTFETIYTNSIQSNDYFKLNVLQDLSNGIQELALDTNTPLIIMETYSSNNYGKQEYWFVVNGSDGSCACTTRTNLSAASQLRDVYNTASSASTTASQAANQASTNASAITALDTRVTALEQGGGAQLLWQYSTRTNVSTMWTTSMMGNNFSFMVSQPDTPIFRPESYSENINVNINVSPGYDSYVAYNATTSDYNDIVLPNATLKLYDASSGGNLLDTISLGTLTLQYDQAKYQFIAYIPSLTSTITSGQTVYGELWFADVAPQAPAVSSYDFTEILSQITQGGNTGDYYLDVNKIISIASQQSARLNILTSTLQSLSLQRLFVSNSTSSKQLYDFNNGITGYADVMFDIDNSVIIIIMHLCNNGLMASSSYKIVMNTLGSSNVWTLNWQSY